MTSLDTTSTEQHSAASRLGGLVAKALTAPAVAPLIALVLTMTFFSVKSENFLQAQNSPSCCNKSWSSASSRSARQS